MDLIEKLPGLADDDLGTLAANARRLARTGTPKQKAAEAALPAIQSEVVARQQRKVASIRRKPRAGRKASNSQPPEE